MRTIYSNYARTFSALILAALTALLASCGSGTTPTPDATSSSSVQLLVSSTQMPSAGGTTVDATAVVLSATGQIVVGQPVVFSTNGDPSAYFSNVSAITDDNGVVTAKLNVGANKTNRDITISATAGTAAGTNTVSVTGTTVSISGNSSLAAGSTTALTISVKDSAGNAMSGVTVAVASQSGNTVAFTGASGATTNSSGEVIASVTASTAATTDVITASAAGAIKTQNLTISNSSFAFTVPIANASIPINTATPVTLHWATGGTAVVGATVDFSASRGTITPSGVTNGTGDATVSITSPSTGLTTISASGPGNTPAASVTVNFYTDSASTVAVQANPGTVAVTTSGTGQTGQNSSVISVVVRDAANNLVQNARVNFSITTDVSGGSLSSSTATTDSNGSASVNYIAGTTSSPQNGVTITATVISITNAGITTTVAGVSGTVNLTVSGLALLVRLGTDNLVTNAPPMNRKTYIARVTDAAGNAVEGVTVSFKLRPRSAIEGYAYMKGTWSKVIIPPATSAVWAQIISATCDNEDDGGGDPTLAYNGQTDPLEDINGDGAVWPSGAASITPTAVTDVYGEATAIISYTKDQSHWAAYIVEARTGGLNSNDPPATIPFYFPGLADDYTDLDITPPGTPSPYGTAGVCTSPL